MFKSHVWCSLSIQTSSSDKLFLSNVLLRSSDRSLIDGAEAIGQTKDYHGNPCNYIPSKFS